MAGDVRALILDDEPLLCTHLARHLAIGYLTSRVPELIEDASNQLTGDFRLLVDCLLDHLKVLDRQVDEIETRIKARHQASTISKRLEKVPGIGPLTAIALAASVGDAKNFDNGRQRATWLSLATCTASSSLSKGMTQTTGPKTSSRATRIDGLTSIKTVAATK